MKYSELKRIILHARWAGFRKFGPGMWVKRLELPYNHRYNYAISNTELMQFWQALDTLTERVYRQKMKEVYLKFRGR